MFIVIDVATIVLASDLAPTLINRGRDRRGDLVPTLNDTMLIHECVFCKNNNKKYYWLCIIIIIY